MMEHTNAVLQGLKNMRVYDCIGSGIVYTFNGVNYTTDEMIKELENNTEIGKAFSQSVYDTIISYMGKFTQQVN